MSDSPPTDISMLAHLEELRNRLMKATLAVALAFLGFIAVSERLFAIVARPVLRQLPQESALVFTSLPDPFFVYLKAAFIAAVLVALPYVLYQIWLLVGRTFQESGRRLTAAFITLGTGLFYAGVAFCYFVVFPAAFRFFLSFESPELKAMLGIKEYVSLFMTLMLAFGAVFETPLVIVFLGLLGICNSNQLRKGRRYFIVFAFVVAAILTPTPDPLNQTLMAVPMVLLFEMGLQILVVIEKREARIH